MLAGGTGVALAFSTVSVKEALALAPDGSVAASVIG